MAQYPKPGERLKEITDKLEQGIQDLFSSEQYKAYLKTMSKFTNYSVNNTLLIFMQRPDASLVAGYGAWQNNFNRHVKRGEHGIKILAPCPYKDRVEMERIDPGTRRPMIGRDGKPVTEQVEITRAAFKPVTVFDLSQTEGEPLPQLGVDELTGSVEHYADFFKALKEISPFSVAFEEITTGAKGYCNFTERRIAINEGMSEVQNVKTAIHEITHATLHDYYNDKEKDLPPEEKKGRNTREVEAESVAYVVCQHYGIETSEYSFPYVAGWEGQDKNLLKASLSTIRETADGLITSIDDKFQELVQAKEQTAPEVEPDNFTLYQLKDGPELHYHRFTSMEQLRADGLTVEAANYSQVYRGLLTENDTLDSIFERFNVDRPEDFHGHSLSVSDVVLLHKGGEGKAYYVDSFGFSELPRFVEQLRENPLETAEKSTEQNYNMIDGQINNLPPELSSEPKQAAYLLGNSAYLTIQTTESGQDYTLYRKNLSEVETGRLEEPGLTMEAARHELMKKFQIEEYKVEPVDWDTLKKQIATTALTGLPPILHDVLTQEGPWLLNPEKEPVVHILWSEHPELSDDLTLPLHVADRLFKQLDEKQRIDRENPDHHGGWYEKTKFEIKCTFQGQPDSYEGRQDFGDGDGSLIDHIRGIAEYYQNDEQLKNRILHELGPDGLQEETASYDMLLNEFVPYLQLHCNLAEMEATAHSGRQTLQAAGELDETGKNTLDYYRAVGSYVEAGQLALNSGNYDLPDAPSLEVFLTPGMDAYKEQVKEEIRQEAASYGMTVEQYAANGWEPVSSYQPVEATSPEQPVTEQKTAPSLDAIEARVQAGEAISVLAIAEAVKAEKSKKPSVHDKLETAKKQTPAKTRTPRTKKPKELERS